MSNTIYDEAQALKPELVAWRRHIHENPEGGPDQPKTAAFVMDQLRSFGLEPEPLGGGVTALIKGSQPGKTILLRADMDALFMPEKSGLPFASKAPGLDHACGHDMHTAMLLGAAKLLSERKEELYGTVKLMFQPAEEIGAGAARMLDAGILKNPEVDVVMGLHMVIADKYPSASLAVTNGVTLASNDMFRVTAIGKGGHGARPENAVDPINMICHIHSLLQSINSREVGCKETFVLTIGQIGGGETANSIPNEAFLHGTLRTLKEETRGFIKKRITQIAKGTAETMGGHAEVTFEVQLPALCNDPSLTKDMTAYMKELVGEDRVYDMPTRMGSEDFAFVTHEKPGVFAFLSGGSIDEGYTVGTHNPAVIFNEDALPVGTATHAYCAIRWLEEHRDQV